MSDDIITEPERAAEPDPKQDLSGGSAVERQSLGQRGFSVNKGWIKIHRKILDWEWYSHESVFRVFTHLLLTVNHEDKKWQGMVIKAGQKVTSLAHLANETGLTVRSVRTALENLKTTGELTIKTTNRFTLISIDKWSDYQVKNDKQTDTPTDNQTTTTKEVKKRRSKEVTSTEETSGNTAAVINLFKDINPSYAILFKRKPQHDAARRLLAREPIERIKGALAFIMANREDRFCPRVSTPIQLEEKWADLITYGASLKKSNQPKWKVWN